MNNIKIYIELNRPVARKYSEFDIHERLEYGDIEVVLLGFGRKALSLEIYYKPVDVISFFDFNNYNSDSYNDPNIYKILSLLNWNVNPISSITLRSDYDVIEASVLIDLDDLGQLSDDIFMTVVYNLDKVR